jgi:glycosyltransferase involved in cell wall biosynthesis
MDWLPNIEGIEWLLKEVWPAVVQNHPSARLFLAGRSMPPSFKQHVSGSVIIEGEVNDAAAFMADKGIMAVPLFSGSGMRVKIIEGMMMGKTIITTPIGIEGIIHEAGKDVIIASNATEFRNAILTCLKHPEKSTKIGTQAKLTATTHYDNKALAWKNHHFLEQVLKSAP